MAQEIDTSAQARRERWERSLQADRDLARYMRDRKQHDDGRDGQQQKGRKS